MYSVKWSEDYGCFVLVDEDDNIKMHAGLEDRLLEIADSWNRLDRHDALA